MFGICVWYVLKKNHILHKTINRYSESFNTYPFLAHITIKHSLDRQEAQHIWATHKKYTFFPCGDIVQTSTQLDEGVFYALEQPLKVLETNEDFHVSLAYRMDKKFQPFEIAIVSDIEAILEEDIDICVADCSGDIKDWKILYK